MGSTAKDTPAHHVCNMTGETPNVPAIKESDTGSKERPLPQQFSGNLKQESVGHEGLELQNISRAKEYTQREAVIRPQQVGKINFKSLQSTSKFSSNSTWPSSSPQSPSGKSRTCERSKKSGKAEHSNPQQLYRLSMCNPRPNPTIGIAYPQQKVTPPKKEEASHGLTSGSYRFHIPSIPEHEAELQPEELSYRHCFQEASSNLTSTNYTSQAESTAEGTTVYQCPLSLQQQPGLQDHSSSQPGSQILFPEFPVNRTASWQSPEKTFNGANYGVSSEKLPAFPEGDKVNANTVPLQFQYVYPPLQDSAAHPLPSEENNRPKDCLDISLATTQVTHSSFTIHSLGEGQEAIQTDRQFKRSEGRPSYAPQYLPSPHEALSSVHCQKDRNKHSTNTKIHASGLHTLEESKSTMPGNPGAFNQEDKEGVVPTSMNDQGCLPIQNIPHSQNTKMLSSNKTYNSSPISTIHMGSVPLEKTIPGDIGRKYRRLSKTWERVSKNFASMDQSPASYSALNDKYQFQCQPAIEQTQPASTNLMTWQHGQQTSAMPKQNRIQLSTQLTNQKPAFPVGVFDWRQSKKSHKNSTMSSCHSKKNDDTFSNLRQEGHKEKFSSLSDFAFDSRTEAVGAPACAARTKNIFFGVSQSQQRLFSKTSSHTPSQVLQVESPLPSTIQNPSPASPTPSISPTSHGSEDTQVTMPGPSPPSYQQQQGKALMPSDHLDFNVHFHSDLSRTFSIPPEGTKEEMLSYVLSSFGTEHPPPPYSTHQLLASSLATANLDQLDVLLTCKQCDQNFNNLASFLDHKQYCGQHILTQNSNIKSMPKMGETRKFSTYSTKLPSSGMSFSLSRCPSDLHLSVLGLSKNGELMSDSEMKGEPKDEILKHSLFPGANTVPVTLPDLEMDDAKLDSLITETLNRLGYQSDNAEIDSSFIDDFVDDDLSTNYNLKTKDSVMFNSRSKYEATNAERSQTQGKYMYDLEWDSLSTASKNTEGVPENTHQDFKQKKKNSVNETTSHKVRDPPCENSTAQNKWTKKGIHLVDKAGEKDKTDSRILLSRKFSERCKLKGFQQHSPVIRPSPPRASSTNWSVTRSWGSAREGKRRKTAKGSWSKELIHKIVQQKNKPHTLHIKETKNQQLSLVTDKLGEYDYVSDSDEESEPLRITSRTRLGHTGCCRYTYSKEDRGKYTYSKKYKEGKRKDNEESLQWKHQSKESDEMKIAQVISASCVKDNSVQRVLRRGNKHSNSSELSEAASISSESITHPKNTNHTDSDSERGLAGRKRNSSNDCFDKEEPQSQVEITKEPNTATVSTSQLSSPARLLLSTDKGPFPSSQILHLNSVTESESEVTETSGVRSLIGNYIIAQAKEEQHSPAGGMIERTEESSCMKRRNRICNSSFKDTTADVHTTGVHHRLMVPKAVPKNSTAFEKISDTVYPSKEEIHGVDCGAAPDSTPHCTAKICVCLLGIQSTAAQSYPAKHCLDPYPMQTAPGLVKSPLSIDTSSMFRDLTGIDNGLYTGISKEGFNTMGPKNDKRELFESSSLHLGLKDWDPIADVSLMLPEISQFKDLSDKTVRKKFSSSYTQFSLSDKIMEDNPNFTNSLSEDELEIKRIVTELETQLHTAKLSSSADISSKELSRNNDPPSRLDCNTGNEQSSMSLGETMESREMSPTIVKEQTLMQPCTDPEASCSSPFQLALLESQQDLQTPVKTDHSPPEHPCVKEDPVSTVSPAAEELQLQDMKSTDAIRDLAIGKSKEVLENEMCTENLMKGLEEISDSILNKVSLTAELKKSNISQSLNSEQKRKECPDAGVKWREKEESSEVGDESHKSEKRDALVFQYQNTDCSSDAKVNLLAQSGESKTSITKCKSGSQMYKNKPVCDHMINFNESQGRSEHYDFELVPGKPEIIEEQHIQEGSSSEEGGGDVLRGEKYSSQPTQLCLSCTVPPHQEEFVVASYSTIPSVSQYSIVPDRSEQEDNSLELILNDSVSAEENTKDPDNYCDSPHSSSVDEGLQKGLAGHVKEKNSSACEDLPQSDKAEEAQPLSPHEEVHEASRCTSPGNNAEDTAVQADHERTTDTTYNPLSTRTLPQCIDLCPTVPDAETMSKHGVTLTDEPLVLTPLEQITILQHETKVDPEHADVPPQGLSGLIVSSLHSMSANSVVKTEENIMDPKVVHQCQPQSVWTHFDRLSPISTHSEQSPSKGNSDELNTNDMMLCDPPVTIASAIPQIIAGLPHVDIGMDKNKSPGGEKSPEIPNEVPAEAQTNKTRLVFLSEFKQNPRIFKNEHLPNYSDIWQSLNENIVNQATLKRSPKDRDHCQVRPLTSVSANSPIPEDTGSMQMPVAPDTPVCLFSVHTSLQNTSTQSITKRTCSALPCPHSSVPSLTNATAPWEICPSAHEIEDFIALRMDLLKKTETEKLDDHEHISATSASSSKENATEHQDPLQPYPQCAEESPSQTKSLSINEAWSKSSPTNAKSNCNNSRGKSTIQKKSILGTVLCEICSASFRTVPGLKRHKAMKHFTKRDMNTAMESKSISCQWGDVLHRKSFSLATGLNENLVLPDPNIYVHSESLGSCIRLPCETAVPSLKRRKVCKQRMTPPGKKAKKSCKSWKSRVKRAHNKCVEPEIVKSDPFSDELHNILKTDIFQVITADNTPRTPCESRQAGKLITLEDLEVTEPRHFTFDLMNNINKHDTITNDKGQGSLHKQGIGTNQKEGETEGKKSSKLDISSMDGKQSNINCRVHAEPGDNYYYLKEHEEICLEDSRDKDTLEEVTFEVKCEKATHLTMTCSPRPCPDLEVPLKAPLACSPRPSSDLEVLLNDETTFSQLFPRDEEMIRKKCIKVYSNRNKKQNPDPCLPSEDVYPIHSVSSDIKEHLPEGRNDSSLITTKKDHCNLETLSIDNGINQDVYHQSTVKNGCKQGHMIEHKRDQVDSGILGTSHFLCRMDNPTCNTVIEWNSPSDLTDMVAKGVQSSEIQISCKIEDPATSCPPQLSDPCAVQSSESHSQSSASHFDGIDIQNVNTKFQLPDIQFLESSEDVSVVLSVTGDNMVSSQDRNQRECRGRKRSEGALKQKDKQYKCKVCFTWFLTLGELNFHKLSHNPSPPPTCYMCVQRKFSSREQLRDHLREKHTKNKAGLWTCGMCLKEISDVWMYNEHLREHATQFARKGQTQTSIVNGLPGCVMQETAMQNFITSIMQQQPSNGTKGEVDKAAPKKGGKTAQGNVQQDSKSVEEGETTGIKTKGNFVRGGKWNIPILHDIPHRADVSQKNVEMHQNCKDPSRDCHHCGKQFPKPFKLQRHLVVHSLQKIFLCSKCPISYQDVKDLKDHLKRKHEQMEESDSKHTTLYTCELCADVMHVIKKSFICSTCNYTFSKKEQFDRHMEKHLSGGHKIFKFRGVVRPSKPSLSSTKDGEFDLPPGKKKKLLADSLVGKGPDSTITSSMVSTQLSWGTKIQVPIPVSPTASDLTETSDNISSGSKDACIKSEDVAGDFPAILTELELPQTQSGCLSEIREHCSSSGHPVDGQTREACEEDDALADSYAIKEDSPLHLCHCQKQCSTLTPALEDGRISSGESGTSDITKPLPPEDDIADAAEVAKREMDVSDAVVPTETSYVHLNQCLKITDAPTSLEEDALVCTSMDAWQKSSDQAIELIRGEGRIENLCEMQKNICEGKDPNSEKLTRGQAQDEALSKPRENTGYSPNDDLKPAAGALGATQLTKTCPKPQLSALGLARGRGDCVRQKKKKKDLKISQSSKVSVVATRENLDVDMRNRKKLLVQSPSKCDWTRSHRKVDTAGDYPVLSCVKDDKSSNKLLPKQKAGGVNHQPKKSTLVRNPPKKAESMCHLNRAYRRRKRVLVRPFHPPASKACIPIVNNVFNKYGARSGGRAADPHAYRTAESQNNLLSQLFGQKLTSFKIPLRKDTSEAMN